MKQRERLPERLIKALNEVANELKSESEDMQEGWESLVIDEKEMNKKRKQKKEEGEVSDMFLDYVNGGKSPINLNDVEASWKKNKGKKKKETFDTAPPEYNVEQRPDNTMPGY